MEGLRENNDNECERINDAEIEFKDTVEGGVRKGGTVLGLEVRLP